MNAVVKVLCVHSNPNFSLPWQRKRQFTSTSSGFLVRAEDGQRWLLTNAHSVEYHAQVRGLTRNVYCPVSCCHQCSDMANHPCSLCYWGHPPESSEPHATNLSVWCLICCDPD